MSGKKSAKVKAKSVDASYADFTSPNVTTREYLTVGTDQYIKAALDRLAQLPTELDRADDVRSYPTCHHTARLSHD